MIKLDGNLRCLCDAALPDCPIIGSLLDFQIFTGRTYAEDIGRNCRHLNSGCSNNRASMCFLRTLSASQDNANAFSQMFPSGAKFVLENRRSVRFLKTKKVTFQNFLLVFPVTIASHLSFAVGGQISVGAPRTCVTWAAARACLLKQTTHPTRHVLQKKSFLKKGQYLPPNKGDFC